MAENAYHRMRTGTPPAPSGCPVDHSFSPFDAVYVTDPYPMLAALRRDEPVFYAKTLGYLVLTRMADVAEVFRRPEDFSSANVQDPVLPVCAAAQEVLSAADYNPVAVMSNCQPPDHGRIRRHTLAGFSARRLRILAPMIRARCDALVDGMMRNGAPAEFVTSLALPLPGETIFRFIGFPAADDRRIKEWTTNRLTFTWGRASDDEQVAIARGMLAYWRYCVGFVRSRLADPADDFTSELLAAHKADPDGLRLREVESIVYGLSFAGHEIVTNFLSNAVTTLLAHREQWDALCANPDRIPNAVEEVLRFNSPQTSWRRVAVRECEIAGVTVPRGTQIFLSLGAANRDEAAFASPDAFDIGRENARNHIAFGQGIHFCLGSRLAVQEAEIVLRVLTERLPSLALVPGQRLEYYPNFTFRGPKALQLTWAG